MKLTTVIFAFLAMTQFGFGQQGPTPPPNYFAQGILNISTEQEMRTLQDEMRQISGLQVVRLDFNTRRFFILTDGIGTVDQAAIDSWFGTYATQLSCIQIGVHGVDVVNPYPFAGCQE